MPRRVAIVQGHPDPAGGHLCHALADAYAQGAMTAGHEAARSELARLDFPLLRTQQDFETGQLRKRWFRRILIVPSAMPDSSVFNVT